MAKVKTPTLVPGPYVLPLDTVLVVGDGYQGVQSASHDRPKLFDAVQMRGLVVLFDLVIYLVAIDEDLQDSADAWLDRDRYVTTALCHELVDHPGRNSVVLSRDAVDDFNVHFAFTGHETNLLFWLVQSGNYGNHKPHLCLVPFLTVRDYHSSWCMSIQTFAPFGRMRARRPRSQDVRNA